jgi:hypothetical protein
MPRSFQAFCDSPQTRFPGRLQVFNGSILGAVLQRSLSRPAHRFGDRPATVAAESANQPVDTTGGGGAVVQPAMLRREATATSATSFSS